ncbi:MAG TPA: mechanosensitive ion channel, partial [Tepidisphaeraceae bacterium]|nr:mechanosensitive ion channel [Tepidisphaeraceae bacterium]
VIEMDNVTGVISRIGIRASVVRTPNAAEVIVPNGMLIANRFTNWTLSNRKRGIDLTISVSREADPKRVMDLLVEIAKQNSLTSKTPSPQAHFADFVPNGMKFELHAWADRFEDWITLRSELALAINGRFAKDGLKIL